jgi:hypothetical protein
MIIVNIIMKKIVPNNVNKNGDIENENDNNN